MDLANIFQDNQNKDHAQIKCEKRSKAGF